MQEPWQLIVNPVAGSGRAGRKHAALCDVLRARGIVFVEHVTEATGQAAIFAQDAWAAGHRRFLVAGGDGTVNEVINGLYGDAAPDTQPIIVPVPLGSGNDWARSRGLQVGISGIVDRLTAGRYTPCPIGRLQGTMADGEWCRYFVNAVGIGLDVCVLQHLPRWRIAAARYAVALLRAFATFSAREVCVIADGKERRGVALVNLCALGAFTGGGMRLAPHAAEAPEKLAVTWIDDVSWQRLLLSGHKIYNGTLGERPEVALYHADKVDFAAPIGEAMQADGDIAGVTPASVVVMPEALLTLPPAAP